MDMAFFKKLAQPKPARQLARSRPWNACATSFFLSRDFLGRSTFFAGYARTTRGLRRTVVVGHGRWSVRPCLGSLHAIGGRWKRPFEFPILKHEHQATHRASSAARC